MLIQLYLNADRTVTPMDAKKAQVVKPEPRLLHHLLAWQTCGGMLVRATDRLFHTSSHFVTPVVPPCCWHGFQVKKNLVLPSNNGTFTQSRPTPKGASINRAADHTRKKCRPRAVQYRWGGTSGTTIMCALINGTLAT